MKPPQNFSTRNAPSVFPYLVKLNDNGSYHGLRKPIRKLENHYPELKNCALDTFLGKTSCLFFPHLSNLAVRSEFTELPFSTCSRYCWNYCHFISSRSCFRPEVSLSIIREVKIGYDYRYQYLKKVTCMRRQPVTSLSVVKTTEVASILEFFTPASGLLAKG